MTSEQFLSIVTLIAHKHGCKIVDVDMDTNTVNIDGPSDECMIDCATELDDILNKGVTDGVSAH